MTPKKLKKHAQDLKLKDIGIAYEVMKDKKKRIAWTPEQEIRIKKIKEKMGVMG